MARPLGTTEKICIAQTWHAIEELSWLPPLSTVRRLPSATEQSTVLATTAAIGKRALRGAPITRQSTA